MTFKAGILKDSPGLACGSILSDACKIGQPPILPFSAMTATVLGIPLLQKAEGSLQ